VSSRMAAGTTQIQANSLVRRVRLDMGLSQQKFADLAGLSRSRLGRIERGGPMWPWERERLVDAVVFGPRGR
jgi:DNA-binding XRE family transcriptional regulator